MSALLKTVLSLSLSGSVLILVLLLLKPVLRDRVSKRWQYYIWLVVIARLLLPLASPVNLAGLIFPAPPAVSDTPPAYSVLAPSAAFTPAEPDAAPTETGGVPDAPPSSDAAPVDLSQALCLVWLGVALALLVRRITLYQSFVRFIRAGWDQVDDVERLDRLSELSGELGIKRPVELYVNPLVSSPLLLGLFRPCIVLPDANLPDSDFDYTIRHELTHCKRRDLLYKWLVQLTLCLHWFNPLVWLMSREISRACELACDEAVLRTLDETERRTYGDTLLRAMKGPGNYKSNMAAVTLNESAQLLKERLGAIMKFKEITRLGRGAALVLTAVLLCGAVLTGAYTAPQLKRETPPDGSSAGNAKGWRSESKTIPNALKGDGETFYYTQDGYYQAPYLFELGWNVKENAGDTYSSTELALPSGGRMTVFFHDSCASRMEEQAVRDALAALLARLKEETADTYLPLTRPFVVSIRNTGGKAPGVLAEEYYQQNALPQFGPVFALLSEAEQRTFLERIYEDGNIAFFSVAVKHLNADSPLFGDLAETFYKDGSIAFRSVLLNALDDDEKLEVMGAELKRQIESMEMELEAEKEELERQQVEEYAGYGITKDGNVYYYNSQRVRIFMDTRANSSFVTLNVDPQGSVDTHVIRDRSGAITAVEYMTQAEADELLSDWD